MWCRNMFKADRLSQVTKRGCRHRWRAIDSSRRQVCSLLNTGGGPEPQIGPLRNTAARFARGDLGCGMRCNRSRKIQQRRTRDRSLHYLKKMSLWLKFIHEEIRFHPVCLAQQLLSALTNIRVRYMYDRGQPG